MLSSIRRLGDAAGVDALACIGERGLSPRGRLSANGATRLLRARDGWVAVSLARPSDVEALPAWLGVETVDDVEVAVATRDTAETVERGRLLGLAVAALGERRANGLYRTERVGDAPPLGRPPRIVDLSSLWAGPLCTRILASRGATVVKVESATRPDGARDGAPAFYDALNAGKEIRTVEFTAEHVGELLLGADVVVEGSRPRALEQLGIAAHEVVADGPRVWLSITGHGRTMPEREWVGFGDDAAVAGGLVEWCEGEPAFFADAVADPLTGMAGAVAVTDALRAGGRWVIDCSLAGVAAFVAAA
jgi:hypothetical protein